MNRFIPPTFSSDFAKFKKALFSVLRTAHLLRVSLVDLGIHVALMAFRSAWSRDRKRWRTRPIRHGLLKAMADEGRELRFSQDHLA